MIPEPFADRPLPIEPRCPEAEQLADVVQRLEDSYEHLQQVHFNQELRRLVEREGAQIVRPRTRGTGSTGGTP